MRSKYEPFDLVAFILLILTLYISGGGIAAPPVASIIRAIPGILIFLGFLYYSIVKVKRLGRRHKLATMLVLLLALLIAYVNVSAYEMDRGAERAIQVLGKFPSGIQPLQNGTFNGLKAVMIVYWPETGKQYYEGFSYFNSDEEIECKLGSVPKIAPKEGPYLIGEARLGPITHFVGCYRELNGQVVHVVEGRVVQVGRNSYTVELTYYLDETGEILTEAFDTFSQYSLLPPLVVIVDASLSREEDLVKLSKRVILNSIITFLTASVLAIIWAIVMI